MDQNEWRILLLGKRGVGKSSTGNSILRETKFQSTNGTDIVQCEQIEVSGKNLHLYDTPGFDDQTKKEDIRKIIAEWIPIVGSRIHAFVLVVDIDNFTKKDTEILEVLCNQNELQKYLMVVLTHKDILDRDDLSIKDYVDRLPQASLLQKIVEKGRCVAIENNAAEKQKDVQIKELITVIESLLTENDESFFDLWKILSYLATGLMVVTTAAVVSLLGIMIGLVRSKK